MENNNQYDELLIKYLANEANAGERTFVEGWMNASEGNLQYFKSLEAAWQLAGAKRTLDYVLDEMDVDEKWDSFKQNVTANETKVVPMQEQIEGENEYQIIDRKSTVHRLLVATAIAASVILVIGLGIVFFTNKKSNEQAVVQSNNKQDSAVALIRHEVNTTGKEKRIVLSDGSLIVLTNNSEVTYREPFISKRDITLIGKAYFKVTYDKTHPFTVTSGAITTTDLGTEFTVTAFKNAAHIIVRLYEGKVVIKAVDKANEKMKKDVYLLPGQQFVYSSQTTTKVKAFEWNKNEAPEEIISEELSNDSNPSLPQNAEGSWYMFNNQSLVQVLDQLSKMYNVEIIYNKKDIQNIYFTRKYNSADSIDNILKEIAILNNLTITKKDNAFIISK